MADITETRFAPARNPFARLLDAFFAPPRADRPGRFTDNELREYHERNSGIRPVSSEAMVQNALRAGLWGRY